MINRKQFTQMAKRVAGSKTGLKNPRLIHPLREWWIGLLIAVVSFTVIAIWSTQTYAQFSNDATAGNMIDEVDPVVYRKSLVESVLADFSIKAERHKSYLQYESNTNIVADTVDETTSLEPQDEIQATTTESEIEIDIPEVDQDDVPDLAPALQNRQIAPTAGIMTVPTEEDDIETN